MAKRTFIHVIDTELPGKVHLLYPIGAALDPERLPSCYVLCGKRGTWKRVDKPARRSEVCVFCYDEGYVD